MESNCRVLRPEVGNDHLLVDPVYFNVKRRWPAKMAGHFCHFVTDKMAVRTDKMAVLKKIFSPFGGKGVG